MLHEQQESPDTSWRLHNTHEKQEIISIAVGRKAHNGQH